MDVDEKTTSVFLSHSRKDCAFVKTMYDGINDIDGRRIWVDWEDRFFPPSDESPLVRQSQKLPVRVPKPIITLLLVSTVGTCH